MPIKKSNWKIVAEVGAPDSGLESIDQENAESGYIELLRDEEQRVGGPIAYEGRKAILLAQNEGLSEQQINGIIQKYESSPSAKRQSPAQQMEVVEPEIANPVSQEDVLNIDSTVEDTASAPNPYATMASYKGEHKKKKNKKGDKKHLKGKGPKADKANEVYHAIMRDRDGKGEPTKEEQASAAAIAWSQAKKTMKKKAYFRGEEAQVLDSYRGMWGEELVRLSVKGQEIDVPRETVEFVSTEVIDPVQQLKDFVSNISEEPETRAQIQANIQNLKTAKDIAYRLVVQGNDLSYGSETAIDAIYDSCERRISHLERRLTSDMTDQDIEYLDSLPQYEIGREVYASNFSQDSNDWMDEVIEKMAAEAEEIDIEKLANEDPLILVSSLSEEVIANATAVKNLAIERVSIAAGALDEETKQWVVSAYVEKAENARRKALASTKQEAHKEVQEKQKTANSIPDEGLFL